MNKNVIFIVAICIMALLTLDLIVRPKLRQKDALKIVNTVLTNWVDGDLAPAMSHWIKEIDSPPVFGLIGYEIKNGTFGKKDGRHTAQIPVALDFSPSNPLPSGQIWIFDMERTRHGWKIKECRRAQDASPQKN